MDKSRGQKKVHFVRHGEGYHNVAQREWRAASKAGEPYTVDTDPEYKFIDALLTPTGVEQVRLPSCLSGPKADPPKPTKTPTKPHQTSPTA